VIWKYVVASVSVILDATDDLSVLENVVGGFHSCADIASHYGFSYVLDNLVVSAVFYFFFSLFLFYFILYLTIWQSSLCKFTALLAPPETPRAASPGESLRTTFTRNKRHGDNRAMFSCNAMQKHRQHVPFLKSRNVMLTVCGRGGGAMLLVALFHFTRWICWNHCVVSLTFFIVIFILLYFYLFIFPFYLF
jgi:hypothetical protein